MESAQLLTFLDPSWLFPFLMYAETHYRFRYFFSLLRKPEPEVLADAPSFVVPGKPLPILLLVKDADQFPVKLISTSVQVIRGNEIILERTIKGPGLIDAGPFWSDVIEVPIEALPGWISVNVEFAVEVRGQERRFCNDNYRGSSHAPLRVYLAEDALPAFPQVHYGDAHTHSEFSSDQVEFGAPLKASSRLAEAMGLSFFVVTDHSYDLDDREDSYLVNDAGLPKWKRFIAETRGVNAVPGMPRIIPGEEVSCRNHHDRNIHLLLLGNDSFVHGSGDSAERWFETRSEHDVRSVLAQRGAGAVAFAAHPFERPPFLQRLLLGRGVWLPEDLRLAGLAGIQLFNGDEDERPESLIKRWVSLLLAGCKLVVLGGNDAHGNFSRFRQLGIPFVSIREHYAHLFGRWKTGIILDRAPDQKHLLELLGRGCSFVTNGPLCVISARDDLGRTAQMGSTIHPSTCRVSVHGSSTRDFGRLARVRLLRGIFQVGREEVVWEQYAASGFSLEHEVRIDPDCPAYVRAEVETMPDNPFDGRPHVAFSNPIWIEP